jgi:hypothetical protein
MAEPGCVSWLQTGLGYPQAGMTMNDKKIPQPPKLRDFYRYDNA